MRLRHNSEMATNRSSDLEQAESFTLRGEGLVVTATNYGGRLLGVVLDGTQLMHGPHTLPEVMRDTCYCGSICGRTANRIAGGSFELDGKTYTLVANDGPNHLHGGTCGFDSRLWSVVAHSEDSLELSLFSCDGDEGYPGNVTVHARYSVQGTSLRLELEAHTDAPTLLNLTNHAYWNLKGKGTIDSHTLRVAAQSYTPMRCNIPTGAIDPVDGSPYDLRTPALLGERFRSLGTGYDDNFVLPGEPGTLREVAELSCGSRRLLLSTDAPGLQVYTGDFLPIPRAGIALEAQSFPDSPHHPNFPSIILRPGSTYRRTIIWQFS